MLQYLQAIFQLMQNLEDRPDGLDGGEVVTQIQVGCLILFPLPPPNPTVSLSIVDGQSNRL
jgi:hypothetical protein